MHGRVKVRTTAEQEALKEKERQEKLQIYMGARAKIFAKRGNGELDKEALGLTQAILLRNPDFATMWNFRREILQSMFDAALAAGNPDVVTEMCKKELEFLDECLMKNPKSYGVWHQRGWAVSKSPKPPHESELALCNKFLKFDERNFHCWDYRRHIVKTSGYDLEKEFQFTLEKISENFSNYSAWHYRSTLLPSVRPSTETHNGVDAVALDSEFETVKSAFYIDPKDQSAWLYHRWLLGREQKPPVLCYVQSASKTLSLVFSQPILLSDASKLVLQANQKPLAFEIAKFSAPSSLLVVSLSEPVESGQLSLEAGAGFVESATGTKSAAQNMASLETSGSTVLLSTGIAPKELVENFQIPSAELLKREEGTCRELLQELENTIERKWALLALIYVLGGLDLVENASEIQQLIASLTQLDPVRRGFYTDLASKYACREYAATNIEKNPDVIQLSNRSLSALAATEHFSRSKVVDLSGNSLQAISGLESCLEATEINLNGNSLTNIPSNTFRGATKLRVLSLRGNKIASVKDLQGLSGLRLEKLDLGSNPVENDPELPAFLSQIVVVSP